MIAVFDAAAPAITPAPRYAAHQYRGLDYRGLLNRQESVDTCGYWNASSARPYTCSPGLACGNNYRSGEYVFGCCQTDVDGYLASTSCQGLYNPFTSCVPYSSIDLCDDECFSYNRVW